jgi:acetyltransferase
VLAILESDSDVDAVLVLHAPSLIDQGVETAQALVEHARSSRKNLLASWMGGSHADNAIDVLQHGGIPTFLTPDKAVKAFMHMVHHKLNQQVLMQTPAALISLLPSAQQSAKDLIERVWGQGREYLSSSEARHVLLANKIPTVDTEFAIDVDQLVIKAKAVGYPVALKIVHQEYCHPFAYGRHSNDRWRGVSTDVENEAHLRTRAKALFDQVCKRYPLSKVLGYSVQGMHRVLDLQQFSVGITRDAEYGALIVFGGGGGRADIMLDRQISLPPLNSALAVTLMKKSHAYYVLKEKSLNFDGDIMLLSKVLVSLSHMVVDLPHIKGCEANILRHPQDALITLGVAIDLAEPQRLTILPYPVGLEETRQLRLSNTEITLRPIQGEDEPMLARFYESLSPESLRYRFFSSRTLFQHEELARFSQIDYDREMVFVAIGHVGGEYEILGITNIYTDANDIEAEFSVIAADNLKGEGLGGLLMDKVIAYAKGREIQTMVGTVLPDNEPMLKLAKRLGFSATLNRRDNLVELCLPLT